MDLRIVLEPIPLVFILLGGKEVVEIIKGSISILPTPFVPALNPKGIVGSKI